jgi:hypothetical protein
MDASEIGAHGVWLTTRNGNKNVSKKVKLLNMGLMIFEG